MAKESLRQTRLEQHVAALRQCRRCPRMVPPPVSGGPVVSRVLLIGQAPGIKEPVLGRPFAWTAGRTLFGWFRDFCGMDETETRARIYFAAVCRCFPGRTAAGGDRVPAPDEIRNCAVWLNDEMEILRPRLVIPVGKLAISQFLAVGKLDAVIGRAFPMQRNRAAFDLIPLP
ncbi:MAG: uracil-DNA glycosylase family protein, partial [Chthoniobacterales bacterium]